VALAVPDHMRFDKRVARGLSPSAARAVLAVSAQEPGLAVSVRELAIVVYAPELSLWPVIRGAFAD